MTLKQAIAELTFKGRQVDELASQAEALLRENEGLRHQIEQLQRRLYGTKSERYEPDQLYLEEVLKEGQSEEPAEVIEEVPVRATVRRKARAHGRLKIPDDIERIEERLDLPEEQKHDPDTGQALVMLREEVSEKLAWKPGAWYVRRFIRPIYVHPDRQGEKAGVYVHPMPESPVEKCKADNSVLALVGVKKYLDHLPLYRQREIFKREGIEIASSTLNAWAIEPILALEPLYEALKSEVLTRPCVFTDDTPVAMLQPGSKKTKTARMWVYLGGCGAPYRFFDFTQDRSRARPIGILGKYRGFVHADAYSGYDELFRKNSNVTEVGCWAHARRKFDEAKNSSLRECSEILTRIGQLYEVEAKVRGSPAKERLAARQSQSVPVLDTLYERLKQFAIDALPASAFGKALGYAMNQREALCRYTTDGRLEIDNNFAENAIRPLALGRKNWLFAGSERGGKACAIAMSLLHSAKACGVNPYDYLHDIYNRIMSYPVSRLHELLPDVWKLDH
jgi:transposase